MPGTHCKNKTAVHERLEAVQTLHTHAHLSNDLPGMPVDADHAERGYSPSEAGWVSGARRKIRCSRCGSLRGEEFGLLPSIAHREESR